MSSKEENKVNSESKKRKKLLSMVLSIHVRNAILERLHSQSKHLPQNETQLTIQKGDTLLLSIPPQTLEPVKNHMGYLYGDPLTRKVGQVDASNPAPFLQCCLWRV